MNFKIYLAGLASFAALSFMYRPIRAKPRPIRSLIRAPEVSQRTDPLPVATLMELLAAALLTGAPMAEALVTVARISALPEGLGIYSAARAIGRGQPINQAWQQVDSAFTAIGQALLLAELSGCAVSPLLLTAAQHHRRQVAATTQAAARRLGVKLSVPLGLAILPAFLFLGVIPVIFGLAQPLLSS